MLTEILEGLYSDMPSEKWDGRWHVTQTLGCERAMAHVARGCLEVKVTPSQHQLMDDGLMHEGDIKQRLDIAGIKILEMDKVYYPADAPIICRPDGRVIALENNLGIVVGTHLTLEIKTVDRLNFDFLALGGNVPSDNIHHIATLRPKYRGQAQAYMRYQGTGKTLFLIKDRALGRYLEQVLDIDHLVGQEIVDRAIRVKALLNANRPCEDIPPSRDFETKLFCPYKIICPDCDYAGTRITDPYFITLAVQYLEAKAVKDDVDTDMGKIKDKMSEALESLGVKSIDVVTGIEGKALRAIAMSKANISADVEVARRLLPEDMFTQIFRELESKYTQLREVIDRG